MDPLRRLRQMAILSAAVVATIVGGTVGFRLILGESWFQSLYRSIITASLTGLDTVPRSDAARGLSIAMALCGLTIIAYSGAVIVEAWLQIPSTPSRVRSARKSRSSARPRRSTATTPRMPR